MWNRLKWFTTPNGKYTMGVIATVGACSVFTVTYLPKSIFIDKYYDFVTMRKYNEPVPVSPHLQKLWTEVLDDLNLSKFYKALLKPFMVFGFDVWHEGSLRTKYGSIIGLPINFTYYDTESIDKEQIILNNGPVNWNQDEAQKLLESFLLSDDSKKYAIAREILMTDNYNIIIQSVGSSMLTGGVYILSAHLNESLSMFDKPRTIRVFMYLVIVTFFWGIWAMQKDILTKKYESSVDEKISQLGVKYVKGAIEFYDKMLQRNIALRTLLGTQGEGLFTVKGNENFIIRMKRLPITHRKNFFEEKLKNLESSTSINNDSTLYSK
ncbi:hypothetical protein PV327_009434 [Microctonus hyperodae]|uniref:Transmembrane protein 177 n=1 Tax=Microctonus hyperodae TaxID=165561 RepID=A0AA39KVW1_MICHY|nr:hypothetical protein PV327_009434 [Microctonus hyperodae]